MDDYMMPNDGESFRPEPFQVGETAEQRQHREAAQGKLQADKDVLQEVVDRLTEHMQASDTIGAIKVDPLTDPAEFMRSWHALQLHKEYLQHEIDYWKGQLAAAK